MTAQLRHRSVLTRPCFNASCEALRGYQCATHLVHKNECFSFWNFIDQYLLKYLSFFDWLVFLPGADSVQVVGTKAGIALPRPSTELVDMTRRRGPVARNIPPDVRAAHPVRYAVYTSSRSPHVHVQVQQPGRCAHCCCGRPLVQ